jgi:hypothetical protein
LALGVILEHLLTTVFDNAHTVFGIKQKKDPEGYTVVKMRPGYYGLSLMFLGLTGCCVYFLIFWTKPEEFILALSITLFFAFLTIYSFLYVKNLRYKFNEHLIVRTGVYGSTKTILWSECQAKGMSIWTQQVTLYNSLYRFRIHQNMLNFPQLARFIQKKLGVTLMYYRGL